MCGTQGKTPCELEEQKVSYDVRVCVCTYVHMYVDLLFCAEHTAIQLVTVNKSLYIYIYIYIYIFIHTYKLTAMRAGVNQMAVHGRCMYMCILYIYLYT